MGFSPAFLDELRRRNPLSQLISRHGVKLVRRGPEFAGLCPFHRERTPSFYIVEERGFFHCFGCGAHGDAIAFVMRADNVDFGAAVATLAAGGTPSVTRALPPSNQAAVGLSEKDERNRRTAWRLWRDARPARGTLLEKYLHSRNLSLPPAPVLRFEPRCWNRETGRELPAMLARVDDPGGEFVAVHRTWLRADGTGKAELEYPKKSLGPVAGAAVRLAPAAPVMAIAEGIENALTAIVAAEMPAWSALSSGGIQRLILPAAVREVIILADHDANGVGGRAAWLGAERWRAEDRRVRVAMTPRPGTDVNDLLMGRGL